MHNVVTFLEKRKWIEYIMKSICIFTPNHLGDIVLSTPLIKTIRLNYPNAHIILIGNQKAKDLLFPAPWFNEFIVVEKELKDTIKAIKSLKRYKVDLGILLPNSFRTALILKLAGVKNIIGYSRYWRGILLSKKLKPEKIKNQFIPVYMADYYLKILQLLDSNDLKFIFTKPELPVSKESEKFIINLLERLNIPNNAHLVGINPGTAFGSSKQWNTSKFAEVAQYLARNGYEVVILAGNTDEAKLAQEIMCYITDSNVLKHTHPLVDPILTIDQLKALIKNLSCLITIDSGPAHIAKALGVPTITLFGPIHPRWSVRNMNDEKCIYLAVECSPCNKKVCKQNNHKCMEQITSEMVIEKFKEIESKNNSFSIPGTN